MPPADNSRFLVAASQARHAAARQRAEQAIEAAHHTPGPATVAGVAKAAGVSRSWLYTQEDLVAAVQTLRNRPSPAGPKSKIASAESLRQKNETLIARNRQLRSELDALRRQLATAHGELRRQRATIGDR
jgi:hypothetical protein